MTFQMVYMIWAIQYGQWNKVEFEKYYEKRMQTWIENFDQNINLSLLLRIYLFFTTKRSELTYK